MKKIRVKGKTYIWKKPQWIDKAKEIAMCTVAFLAVMATGVVLP